MICLVCGCSEDRACLDAWGACAWYVPGLCDFCVLGFRAPPFGELLPNFEGLELR